MRFVRAVMLVGSVPPLLTCPQATTAQLPDAVRAVGELGLGSWSGDLSLSGAMGIALSRDWVGVTLSPAGALLRDLGNNDRYVRRRTGEGTVCIDELSGATYPDSYCTLLSSLVVWDPRAEVHLSAQPLGLPVWLGVGVRGGVEHALTWSLGYLYGSTDERLFRIRVLYSPDAWHLGFGLVWR